jgi:hypothetical protein
VASTVLIGTHPRSIPYPIPCRRDCRPSPLIPLSSSHRRHRILIAQFLELELCVGSIDALHKHDTLWGMASVRRAVRHPKLSRCTLHMSQSFLYGVAETRSVAGPSKWSRGCCYKMQPCSPRLLLDASVSAVPASATLLSGTLVSTDAYRFVALHVDLPQAW